MPRPFPLQLVLDLTERRAEARSRAVKLAHADWLRARTQVVRLQQQRAHFSQSLSLRIRQGCPSELAQDASVALRQYQRRLAAGIEAVDAAHTAWQQAIQLWQSEKKRLEALQVLAQRHAEEEARRDAKQETRLHDELAAKAFSLRLSPSRRESGFMFAEADGND